MIGNGFCQKNLALTFRQHASSLTYELEKACQGKEDCEPETSGGVGREGWWLVVAQLLTDHQAQSPEELFPCTSGILEGGALGAPPWPRWQLQQAWDFSAHSPNRAHVHSGWQAQPPLRNWKAPARAPSELWACFYLPSSLSPEPQPASWEPPAGTVRRAWFLSLPTQFPQPVAMAMTTEALWVRRARGSHSCKLTSGFLREDIQSCFFSQCFYALSTASPLSLFLLKFSLSCGCISSPISFGGVPETICSAPGHSAPAFN